MVGKGRVTSHDVAKKAGVSRSVVSAVLNQTRGIGVSGETRRAVYAAIEELGYRVDAHARGMRTGRSRCIAAYGDLRDPVVLQVLQGLQRACAEEDYHLLLYSGHGKTKGSGREKLIDLFLQRRIDGIVTKDSTSFADPKWLELIHVNGVPYVSVEGYPEEDRVQSVLMDYAAGIGVALDYMWRRTRKLPVYLELYSGSEYRPNWGDRERRRGYVAWSSARGLTPEVRSWPDEKWDVSAPKWIELLSRLPEGTPILVNWSRGAVHVYRAAHQLRMQVGEQVHVVAADNTERVNEHLVPSLTAVEVPYEEMGASAGYRLIAQLEGTQHGSMPAKLWVPAMLQQRESL